MKNPFVKQDNTAIIAIGATSVIAAAALAYLYLTENGSNFRESVSKTISDGLDDLGKKIKENFKDAAADVVSRKTFLSKKVVKAVADHMVE